MHVGIMFHGTNTEEDTAFGKHSSRDKAIERS